MGSDPLHAVQSGFSVFFYHISAEGKAVLSVLCLTRTWTHPDPMTSFTLLLVGEA